MYKLRQRIQAAYAPTRGEEHRERSRRRSTSLLWSTVSSAAGEARPRRTPRARPYASRYTLDRSTTKSRCRSVTITTSTGRSGSPVYQGSSSTGTSLASPVAPYASSSSTALYSAAPTTTRTTISVTPGRSTASEEQGKIKVEWKREPISAGVAGGGDAVRKEVRYTLQQKGQATRSHSPPAMYRKKVPLVEERENISADVQKVFKTLRKW